MPKIKLFLFDKYNKSNVFFEKYGNETVEIENDPLVENKEVEEGFFITKEDLNIGLNDFRNLSLVSFKRDLITNFSYPVIYGDSFILEDKEFTLFGNQYDVSLFGHNSDYFPFETSRRHIIDTNLNHVNKLYCFQFNHRNNTIEFFSRVDQFSTVKSNDEVDYGTSGHKWNWATVDTSIPEFIIDYRFTEGKEICFNQPLDNFLKSIGPDFTSTEINDYRNFLEKPIQDDKDFHVRWIPKAPCKDLRVFEILNSTELIEWTATAFEGLSLSTSDRYFNLENKIGRLCLNSSFSTSIGEILISYKESIAVALANDFTKNLYDASELKLGRVNDGNVGSYYLGLQDSKIESFSIDLKIDDTESDGNSFNYLYYGDRPSEIEVKISDGASQLPVVGEEVEIKIRNGLGKIIGEDVNKTIKGFTDNSGYFRAFIQPPKLGNECGVSNISKLDSTTLVLNNGNYFDLNKGDIYTYLISKDDPFTGRDGTNIQDQDILWSDSLLNGRKIILYSYDSISGDFKTVQPTAFDSTSFTYPSSLVEVNSTDTSIQYGGYFITGPQYIEMEVALVNNKRWTNKSLFKILCKHRNQAQGNISYGGNGYELGWKLLSNGINLSNQIGGALYLTLNPLSGNHTIIFETSNRDNSNPVLDINLEVV